MAVLEKLAVWAVIPSLPLRGFPVACPRFWSGGVDIGQLTNGGSTLNRSSNQSSEPCGFGLRSTHVHTGLEIMSWLVNLSMLLTRGFWGYFLVRLACY